MGNHTLHPHIYSLFQEHHNKEVSVGINSMSINISRRVYSTINGIFDWNTRLLQLGEQLSTDLLKGKIKGIYRTVPSIMQQAIIYEDENFEVRFHIYESECQETYIHNHKNPFISVCLEGGYTEKLWGVNQKQKGDFYEFSRMEGGILGPSVKRNGELTISATREHYPGNTLLVPSNLFHTIQPSNSVTTPITFIVKSKFGSNIKGVVFSHTQEIKEPTDPIRNATNDEINMLLVKLEAWLNKRKALYHIKPLI